MRALFMLALLAPFFIAGMLAEFIAQGFKAGRAYMRELMDELR